VAAANTTQTATTIAKRSPSPSPAKRGRVGVGAQRNAVNQKTIWEAD